ncbi:MAG: cell division protein ZapA [Rhodobacteraceae bacterium]|jgi:cell division protein ZapA|nr:cell division protein ZapA [Paracoccaceae bacterium]
MPDITISVGGRDYTVACQDGEEHFLQAAARLLDGEASELLGQIGRLTEARLLLMAGLLLADKTAGIEDQLRAAQQTVEVQAAELATLRKRPAPAPQRIEVPVIPAEVTETMAELAARAEALAARMEEAAAVK